MGQGASCSVSAGGELGHLPLRYAGASPILSSGGGKVAGEEAELDGAREMGACASGLSSRTAPHTSKSGGWNTGPHRRALSLRALRLSLERSLR